MIRMIRTIRMIKEGFDDISSRLARSMSGT